MLGLSDILPIGYLDTGLGSGIGLLDVRVVEFGAGFGPLCVGLPGIAQSATEENAHVGIQYMLRQYLDSEDAQNG